MVKPAAGCDSLKNQDAVHRNCLAGFVPCYRISTAGRTGQASAWPFPLVSSLSPRAVRHHNRVITAVAALNEPREHKENALPNFYVRASPRRAPWLTPSAVYSTFPDALTRLQAPPSKPRCTSRCRPARRLANRTTRRPPEQGTKTSRRATSTNGQRGCPGGAQRTDSALPPSKLRSPGR